MKFLLALGLLMQLGLSFAQTRFTDDSLVQLLTLNRQGIIYLWSPLMPLSVAGRNQIEQIASELNLPVQLLQDPFAAKADADAVLASERLMKAGVLDHFPAMVLYHNGELKYLLHGYEAPVSLKQIIQEQLEIP